jgi:Kyakuja-Dileera-Zisupton transposase
MDEPYVTNSSFFISKDAVQQMEEEVASSRKSPKRPQASSNIPVANEILDECEKSFKAAQESRSKASKNFFDDTGLIALICRHDCVLFLANLQSTGEKQHYALALLAALFKELPEDWTVGVLYDIGCQLHRSCEKVRSSYNNNEG